MTAIYDIFLWFLAAINLLKELINKLIISAHCILVNSSTVISWTSLFVILDGRAHLVTFILSVMENPVNKQCRP